ncbi:MAG: ERCC4 domain-containing protein [Prevotellaceae bacterium]|nr:ERCC4 domain-containing protein [Prevotellaceae bacterium]
MHIIEDTRQKKGMHEIKHNCFDQMGVELIRNMLPFGDYALPPKVSIDTKANMEEIAQNINGSHQRFKEECVKAKNAGCQLIILTENTVGINSIDEVHTWINPELVYRPKAITGQRLEKAMKTMSERYGVRFEFCTPEDSAKRIMELLNNG